MGTTAPWGQLTQLQDAHLMLHQNEGNVRTGTVGIQLRRSNSTGN